MPVKGLRFAIPDDLSTDDLTCFQIMWPNTPKWRSILAGLVYMVARGRTWDERTGSVIEAKTAGQKLFWENVPLVYCEDTTTPPDEPDYPASGAWCGDWWCDDKTEEIYDMTCSPCPPIKIEEGILYWFNCGVWVEVGPVGTETTNPDDPIIVPEDVDPPLYTACAKASAIVDVLWTILDAAWDVDGDSYPWTWISQVQNEVPYELKNTAVINLILTTFQMDLLQYEKTGALSAANKTQMICRAAQILSDGYTGVTEDEYYAMRATMRGYFGIDVWMRDMIDFGMIALGQKNISNIALSGASSSFVGDCDCPEELDPVEEPTTGGWYLKKVTGSGCEFLVPADASKWTGIGYQTPNVLHDVFGVVFDVVVNTADYIFPMNSSHAVSEDAVDLCTAFDFTQTGNNDTSNQITTLNRVCHGHSDAFDEVFGAGTYNLIGNGRTWSADPNSPLFVAGLTIDWYYRASPWKTAVSGSFADVWLLHNENSPSHQ